MEIETGESSTREGRGSENAYTWCLCESLSKTRGGGESATTKKNSESAKVNKSMRVRERNHNKEGELERDCKRE